MSAQFLELTVPTGRTLARRCEIAVQFYSVKISVRITFNYRGTHLALEELDIYEHVGTLDAIKMGKFFNSWQIINWRCTMELKVLILPI
jgi:hypothetical protein